MAISIATIPNKYTPSDNPIIWSWYSSNYAQPNFSYIVEIYVDAVLDSQHQIFAELGGGLAHFDISEVILPITPSAKIGITTPVTDALNYRTVYIRIREFYGTTPAYGSSTTTSSIYPFKACLSQVDFDSWDYTDYKPTASTKKFLTDIPTIDIRQGQDYYLTMITDSISTIGMSVDFYDEDNTLIGGVDYSVGSTYKISQFNFNTDNYISFLTQPVLDTVSYVLFRYIDGDSLSMSETKRINIDNGCDYGAELIWLNKYGGFDVFNYGFNMVTSSETTEKTYEKQYGGWEYTTYTLNSANSGVHSYFKTATDKVQLVSNYVNSEIQNWLVNSAYISPLVYMFDSIRQLVNIANTSYSYSNDRFVEETTEIVDLKLPNMRKSSRL